MTSHAKDGVERGILIKNKILNSALKDYVVPTPLRGSV